MEQGAAWLLIYRLRFCSDTQTAVQVPYNFINCLLFLFFPLAFHFKISREHPKKTKGIRRLGHPPARLQHNEVLPRLRTERLGVSSGFKLKKGIVYLRSTKVKLWRTKFSVRT